MDSILVVALVAIAVVGIIALVLGVLVILRGDSFGLTMKGKTSEDSIEGEATVKTEGSSRES